MQEKRFVQSFNLWNSFNPFFMPALPDTNF